jgi:hypothetical protein
VSFPEATAPTNFGSKSTALWNVLSTGMAIEPGNSGSMSLGAKGRWYASALLPITLHTKQKTNSTVAERRSIPPNSARYATFVA